jgi:RNA polymerase primary sigma factor
LGRAPTDEELGQEFGVTMPTVRAALAASRTPVSLEIPLGEDEESTLGAALVSHTALAPDEQAYERILQAELREILEETLTSREHEVLQLRFGLGNGGVYPLEKIGAMLGLTRERVRQIEAGALTKLRRPQVSRRLEESSRL